MTLRRFAVLYSVILMLILAGVLVGYRYFVTIPDTQRAIDVFHERELKTLQSALNKEVGFLMTMNYDYAVWDGSYNFMKTRSEEFIAENMLDDTFTSLRIDGIFYYDLDHNQLFGKGFDHLAEEPLDFPELNLKRHPELQTIFPKPGNKPKGVPQNGGFISTSIGPVMFSATEIHRSDRSGKARGVLVFIRKIRPTLLHSLQEITQLNLSSQVVIDPDKVRSIPKLDGSLHGEHYRFVRQRLIESPSGEPVLLLQIRHNNQQTSLFDSNTLLTLALLILFPLSMLIFVNYFLVNPVASSARFIRRIIETEQFKTIETNYAIKELQQLSEDFNELISVVNHHKEALEQLSLTDGLTGIGNRRAFEQFMEQNWARMQRNHGPVALLICDIDYFKPFNDHYGHQAGDSALIQVAQTLAGKVNRSGDLVARYGGEEFAVVLADTDEKNCDQVVNMLLQAIRDLDVDHNYSTVSDRVTISIGAAIITSIGSDPLGSHYEQFIKAADDALYQAKENGRNRAVMVRFIPQSGLSEPYGQTG